MGIDVIIIGDSTDIKLQPLTHHTSYLLLPICGRTVIDHLLESLTPLDINQVTLLTHEHSAKVRKFIGLGERWGLNIKLVTTLGNTTIEDVLTRYDIGKDNDCLLLNAQYFRSGDLDAVVSRFQSEPGQFITGSYQDEACGLSYYCKNAESYGKNQENRSTDLVENERNIDLSLEYCQNLCTLEHYQQANFWVAENNPKYVLTRGKQKYPNVIAGPGCVISEQNLETGKLFTGVGCQIHSEARCNGIVILGNNVIVDRHTSIKNSLILDETYIGEHLKIENSIIWRNTLINVDKDSYFTLEDDRLIGSLSKTALILKIKHFIGRSIAGIALLLSLPLWIIALVDALVYKGMPIVKPTRYVGNGRAAHQPHRQIKSAEIQSRFRLLAKLPLLFELVNGNIKWFGVSICEPEMLQNREESWQFIRDSQPIGLIGPYQIESGTNSTVDERLLADATFADSNKINLIGRMCKKVFRYRLTEGLSSNVSSR